MWWVDSLVVLPWLVHTSCVTDRAVVLFDFTVASNLFAFEWLGRCFGTWKKQGAFASLFSKLKHHLQKPIANTWLDCFAPVHSQILGKCYVTTVLDLTCRFPMLQFSSLGTSTLTITSLASEPHTTVNYRSFIVFLTPYIFLEICIFGFGFSRKYFHSSRFEKSGAASAA